MEPKRLLVVDDEEAYRRELEGYVAAEGFEVLQAADGLEALEQLRKTDVRLVLLDVRMPRLDGVDTLRQILKERPQALVIMMASPAALSLAMDAIKLGAYDFAFKPCERDHLLRTVAKACQVIELEEEVSALRGRTARRFRLSRLVGKSPAWLRAVELAKDAALSEVPVLLRGEVGTGKRFLAHAIHYNSSRREGPLVEVDCQGSPGSLLDAELLRRGRRGAPSAWERGHGGTVLLREVAAMSQPLQRALRRERPWRGALGEGEPSEQGLGVRLLATASGDLEDLVQRGRFDEGLYFSLGAFPIPVPPLREREGDVLPLSHHFLGHLRAGGHRSAVSLSPAAEACLTTYEWPGNVLELEHLLHRARLLCRGAVIDLEHLPPVLTQELAPEGGLAFSPMAREIFPGGCIIPWDAVEKKVLAEAIEKCGRNLSLAAEKLKIGRATLYRKVKKFGIHI